MKAYDNRVLYKDTFLYKGVQLIYIDRDRNAMYWINRQGMKKADTVMDYNSGDMYDVYRNDARGLACCVPV